MKIERVDEKTVKCFLSNEELEEYDIDYKDFVMRNDKAREVVQEIIQQAEVEVGYRPPQFAFDLQIMVLPEQGMLLTFSEKDPVDFKDGEQILECLKDMTQILQRTKDKIMAAEQNIQTAADSNAAATVQGENAERPEEAVFVFDKLSAVMNYAAVMPGSLRVNSALYQLDKDYYLYLQKGNASYERYSRACVQAMEFGTLYTAETDRMRFLWEHAECLIPERALKALR